MNKKIVVFLAAMLAVFAVAVCVLARPQSDEEIATSVSVLKAPTSLSEVPSDSTTANSVEVSSESNETKAEELILRAFDFDVSEYAPDVSACDDEADANEGQTTLTYAVQDDDVYIVEFRDGLAFPATLYHLCHFDEESSFDLSEEGSDYFKEELTENAKEFLENLYGVDCSNAEVHAYGYGNKIAVQLKIAEDQVFHVRFYYDDTEPVGVLFYNGTDAFDEAMELNHAKMYF